MVEFKVIPKKDDKGLYPSLHFKYRKKEVLYDDRNAPGEMFLDNDEHTTTDGKRFTAKVKWFYAQSE
jgi:hypothetical protein